MVPFDDKSPFVTSGIRIGTAAITTRGLKEKHMEKIVEMIDAVLMNPEDEKITKEVRKKVNKMMEDFPLYKD
jgi:glycine hydroxymethyltransferase